MTPKRARELIEFLDVDRQVNAKPDYPPWRAIAGPGFAEVGKEHIPWDWLGQPQLALHYAGWFAQSLLWGILHSREAEAALNDEGGVDPDWWTPGDLGSEPQEKSSQCGGSHQHTHRSFERKRFS